MRQMNLITRVYLYEKYLQLEYLKIPFCTSECSTVDYPNCMKQTINL